MPKMMSKRWVGACGAMAVIALVWINVPLSQTSAQAPPALVPVMISNPVLVKGATRPAEVVLPGDRAVLAITNVADEALEVRMAIRDALNFSKELATAEVVLQSGEGATLPYVENEAAFRSVIGLIAPAGRPGGSDWAGSSWNGNGRVFVTSLSVVDEATNTTRFVVGTNAMPLPRTAFEREVRR
jgi:hypothetical protein